MMFVFLCYNGAEWLIASAEFSDENENETNGEVAVPQANLSLPDVCSTLALCTYLRIRKKTKFCCDMQWYIYFTAEASVCLNI